THCRKMLHQDRNRAPAEIDDTTLAVNEWEADNEKPAGSQYSLYLIKNAVILGDVLMQLEAHYKIDRLVPDRQNACIRDDVKRVARCEIYGTVMLHPDAFR